MQANSNNSSRTNILSLCRYSLMINQISKDIYIHLNSRELKARHVNRRSTTQCNATSRSRYTVLFGINVQDTYLLLAEFSVRTGNYGPTFFRAINRWKKTRIRNLQYGSKNEANKMFIIWLLPVWETRNKCRTHDLTVILTGVKKESFYWRTKTIVHNKGFPRN